MPLITPARAIELVPNFPAANQAVMSDLVNAASDMVERYCARTFAATSYDVLMDGTGHANMLLDQYPVISVSKVRWGPVVVVQLRNTDPDVAEAAVRMDGTTAVATVPGSLILTSSKNGTTTTSAIDLTACPTLTSVAAAVNAFASDGWYAVAPGNYGAWATTSLLAPQSGFDAKFSGSGLWLHTYALPNYLTNYEIGELVSPTFFHRGYRNWRVQYTAGYATIPASLQEAVAELATAVYYHRGINPHLQSESLGQYSYTLNNAAMLMLFDNLSATAKMALSLFKSTRIKAYKV